MEIVPHHYAPHNVRSTLTGGKPLESTQRNRLAHNPKETQETTSSASSGGPSDENGAPVPASRALVPQHENSPTSLLAHLPHISSRLSRTSSSQINRKTYAPSATRTQLYQDPVAGRSDLPLEAPHRRSNSVKCEFPLSQTTKDCEAQVLVPHEDGKARFENGMRVSTGYGRMEQDYTGQVLPMIGEYQCVGWVPTMEPWMVRGDIYNRIVDPWKRLDVEISDFLAYMMRSEMEIDGRQICQTRVAELIKSVLSEYPSHDIQVYGSERTMTGLPLADIDIMISVPSIIDYNPYSLRDRQQQVLEKLRSEFLTKEVAERAEIRADASIPLLEITEKETSIEFDISFDHGHFTSTLKQMKMWIAKYDQNYLVPLVLLIKHALGMRKLGLGTATELYQGGFSSYIIICMVVVFLDARLKRNVRLCEEEAASEHGLGKAFLGFLKFWAIDFDWDKKGITIAPPGIVDKLPSTPAFMFEVRNPSQPIRNMAIGSFGSRHIKETINYFYTTLIKEIECYDSAYLIASTPSTHFLKKKENKPPNRASHSCNRGLLGSVIGGKYTWHEDRRRKIVSAGNAALGFKRMDLPPHVRVQIGRHHEVALKKEELP